MEKMMSQTEVKRTVLLVDDDDDFLFQHRLHLETAGFNVLVAHGQKEAEAILARQRPDLAVIDVMMENPDAGFTLCHRIRKQDASIPVILVTSVNSETGLDFTLSTDEQRSWIKADALLSKPIRFEQLQREIDRVFSRPARESVSRTMDTLQGPGDRRRNGHAAGRDPHAPRFLRARARRQRQRGLFRRPGRIGRGGPRRRSTAARPTSCLLDHKMPGISGLEVLDRLAGRETDMLTIMITAYASIETAVAATKRGAYDFLAKPFTPDELKSTIRKAAARLILAKQARQLAEEKRRVRFEFIRVLGHELKAPLNAVAGYLDILQNHQLGDDLAAYDELVARSLTRMDGMRKLIADLLDLTQIESGEKNRELTQVDLAAAAAVGHRGRCRPGRPAGRHRRASFGRTAGDFTPTPAKSRSSSTTCSPMPSSTIATADAWTWPCDAPESRP